MEILKCKCSLETIKLSLEIVSRFNKKNYTRLSSKLFTQNVQFNVEMFVIWKEISIFIGCWKFLPKNSKNKYLHFSFLFENLQVKKKPQYFLYSRETFIDLFNTFLETCGISFTFHSFFNIYEFLSSLEKIF